MGDVGGRAPWASQGVLVRHPPNCAGHANGNVDLKPLLRSCGFRRDRQSAPFALRHPLPVLIDALAIVTSQLTNEFKFPLASFHHASETYLVPDLLKKM